MIWQGWTAENDAKLTSLFEKGWSFSQIGVALGCSRNAAIGRAGRKGMKRGKPTSPLAPNRPHRSRIENITRAGRGGKSDPAGTIPVRPFRTSIRVSSNGRRAYAVSMGEAPVQAHEEPGAATVLTLGAHMCKWPIGDPSTDGFTFCGRRMGDDGPYCVEHARVAYLPMDKRRMETVRSLRRYL